MAVIRLSHRSVLDVAGRHGIQGQTMAQSAWPPALRAGFARHRTHPRASGPTIRQLAEQIYEMMRNLNVLTLFHVIDRRQRMRAKEAEGGAGSGDVTAGPCVTAAGSARA